MVQSTPQSVSPVGRVSAFLRYLTAPFRFIARQLASWRSKSSESIRPLAISEPSLPEHRVRRIESRIVERYRTYVVKRDRMLGTIHPSFIVKFLDRVAAVYSATRARHRYSQVLITRAATLEKRLRYRVSRLTPGVKGLMAIRHQRIATLNGLAKGLSDGLGERRKHLSSLRDHHIEQRDLLRFSTTSTVQHPGGVSVRLPECVHDLQQSKATYDLWRRSLQRPAFSEDFKILSDNYKDERITYYRVGWQKIEAERLPTPQKDEKRLKNMIGWLKRVLPRALLILMVPAEIAFSLPAFRVLIEGDLMGALAGATIFAAILLQLGYAAGSFAARSIDWYLPADQPTSRPIPRSNTSTILAAVVVTIIGVYAAVLGASLRSIVPEVIELRRELTVETNAPIGNVGSGSFLEAEPVPVDQLAQKARDLRRQKVATLLSDPLRGFSSTDGHIGFIVYLALFLIAALHRYFKVDPVFNFELAAADYGANKNYVEKEMLQHEKLSDALALEIQAVDDEVTRLNNKHFPGRERLLELQKEVEHLDVLITNLQEIEELVEAHLFRVRTTRLRSYHDVYLDFSSMDERKEISKKFAEELEKCASPQVIRFPGGRSTMGEPRYAG